MQESKETYMFQSSNADQNFTTETKSQSQIPDYALDREELLRIRDLKLLTSDRDYIFFALRLIIRRN